MTSSTKTATAVNLAAAAYEAGRRVLLIDLEPQASATEHQVGLQKGQAIAWGMTWLD